MRLSEFTDEELFSISLRKNSKGCATVDALRAQRMLRERHLMDWDGTGGHRPEGVPYGDNETEW